MSPAHALELVLDEQSDTAVRQVWHGLDEAQVPSLARHRGATHRPHVTVVTAPGAPERRTLERAELLWAPMLPVGLDVAGTVLLGRRRLTLALLLAVPDQVRAIQAELAAEWVGSDGRPWVPHLSLAARLRLAQVGAALQHLSHRRLAAVSPRRVVATGLRWWDPEAGDVARVAGAAA